MLIFSTGIGNYHLKANLNVKFKNENAKIVFSIEGAYYGFSIETSD